MKLFAQIYTRYRKGLFILRPNWPTLQKIANCRAIHGLGLDLYILQPSRIDMPFSITGDVHGPSSSTFNSLVRDKVNIHMTVKPLH